MRRWRFYERRYAWGNFPDGQRKHVLLTLRYLVEESEGRACIPWRRWKSTRLALVTLAPPFQTNAPTTPAATSHWMNSWPGSSPSISGQALALFFPAALRIFFFRCEYASEL